MSRINFPANFLWGTATAAHQVEGQNLNCDWYRWETQPDSIKNGDSSLRANDWWGGKYQGDFDLAQRMGQNSHRMSIEWSRIEPREGEWDGQAIAFYRGVLTALRDRGMTPLVTLFHFTTPLWLCDRGGWENPDIIPLFARFSRRAAEELGDLCQFWATLNEPNLLAYQGYLAGQWPPHKKDVASMARVIQHQVEAHAAAYHALKLVQPDCMIGIAHHQRPFRPYQEQSPLDRMTAGIRDWFMNRLVLDALAYGQLRTPLGVYRELPGVVGTQDYIGLNYYYTERTIFDLTRPAEVWSRSVYQPATLELIEHFANAGDIEPEGLEQRLTKLSRVGLPIYITENGIFEADADNQSRYLVTHLQAVHRAMTAGADVRGYYWWTLVDNFEWAEGYEPRFGLYRNDLTTQVRTAKPVVEVYSRIIKENGIPDDLIERYGRAN